MTLALPSLADLRDAAVPFALPLARRFRGIDVREGMVIHGPSGWGEFAPFDDYDDERSARWLASAIEAAHGSWPAPRRSAVAVNAIIPAVDAAAAAELATAAIAQGCSTIKVKVGAGQDEARVAAVRDALGDEGAIRIDANAAWTVDEARDALRRLVAFGVEYVEQPCATLDECAALRRGIDVRIAVDESLRMSADPHDPALHARIREAADVLILKAAPLGGVHAGLAIASSVGLPVVVSGSLDSSVGLGSGLALAAALEEATVSGLGTGSLLAADLVATPVVPADGLVPVARVAPDPDRLLAAGDRLGQERAAAWHARLARAHARLAARA